MSEIDLEMVYLVEYCSIVPGPFTGVYMGEVFPW
jgi:hypothetical protein